MVLERLKEVGDIATILSQQPDSINYPAWVALILGIVAAGGAGWSLRNMYRELEQDEAIDKFIQPPDA